MSAAGPPEGAWHLSAVHCQWQSNLIEVDGDVRCLVQDTDDFNPCGMFRIENRVGEFSQRPESDFSVGHKVAVPTGASSGEFFNMKQCVVHCPL